MLKKIVVNEIDYLLSTWMRSRVYEGIFKCQSDPWEFDRIMVVGFTVKFSSSCRGLRKPGLTFNERKLHQFTTFITERKE